VTTLWPTERRLSKYVEHVVAQRTPAFARRHIASLRAFSRMLESQGLSTGSAALRLPRRPETARVEELSPAGQAALARLSSPKSTKSVRDYALSVLHEFDHISVAQLHALDVEDVNLEAGALRLASRHGRERLVLISAQPAAALRRWVALRVMLGAQNPALFISLHWTTGRSRPGTRLSSRGVSDVLCQVRKELTDK